MSDGLMICFSYLLNMIAKYAMLVDLLEDLYLLAKAHGGFDRQG